MDTQFDESFLINPQKILLLNRWSFFQPPQLASSCWAGCQTITRSERCRPRKEIQQKNHDDAFFENLPIGIICGCLRRCTLELEFYPYPLSWSFTLNLPHLQIVLFPDHGWGVWNKTQCRRLLALTIWWTRSASKLAACARYHRNPHEAVSVSPGQLESSEIDLSAENDMDTRRREAWRR